MTEERESYILNYLHHNLSDSEMSQFEDKMERDELLKVQTQSLQNLISVLKDPEMVRVESILFSLREEKLAEIKSKENPISKKPGLGKNSILTWLFSGLLSLLLTGTVIGLYLAIFGTDVSELYEQSLVVPSTERLTYSSQELTVKSAISAYNQEKWAVAAEGFGSVKNRNITLEFYYLVARLLASPEELSTNIKFLEEFKSELTKEQVSEKYKLQLEQWIDYYRGLILIREGKRTRDAGKKIITDLNEQVIVPPLSNHVSNLYEKIQQTQFFY